MIIRKCHVWKKEVADLKAEIDRKEKVIVETQAKLGERLNEIIALKKNRDWWKKKSDYFQVSRDKKHEELKEFKELKDNTFPISIRVVPGNCPGNDYVIRSAYDKLEDEHKALKRENKALKRDNKVLQVLPKYKVIEQERFEESQDSPIRDTFIKLTKKEKKECNCNCKKLEKRVAALEDQTKSKIYCALSILPCEYQGDRDKNGKGMVCQHTGICNWKILS